MIWPQKKHKDLLPSDLNNDHDSTLAGFLKQGHMHAFNELYAKYHGALYNNVLKFTKDSSCAEDIVQDTFVSLWQNRTSIDAGKSVAGWLFVNSYHRSVNWQKRKLLQNKTEQILAQHPVPIDMEEDIYPAQMQVLEDALRQLSPQKRRVLELCKLHGSTYKVTAAELNISRHTVKEYLRSALESIKKYALAHPVFKTILSAIMFLQNGAF